MSRFDDEADVVECYESSGLNSSLNSNARDTSNTTREFDLDNTRDKSRQSVSVNVSVNTRDSILDFSRDQDDEEEQQQQQHLDNSILFDDLHQYPTSLEQQQQQPREVSREVASSSMRTGAAAATSTSTSSPANKAPTKKSSIMDGLTFYSVTDSFVDSLCTSTVCDTSNSTSNATTTATDRFGGLHPSCGSASIIEVGCGNWAASRQSSSNNGSAPNTTTAVEDVWNLLGCGVSTAGEAEMEDIWNLHTGELMRRPHSPNSAKPNMPAHARASIKRRLRRIHSLRMERVSGASRHGVTITNSNNNNDDEHARRSYSRSSTMMTAAHSRQVSHTADNLTAQQQQQQQPHALPKARSMIDDPLANYIGHGVIDPIPMMDCELDGYDSDPEVVNCSSAFHHHSSSRSNVPSSLSPQPALEQHEVMQAEPLPLDESEMMQSVQRTLNSTWTLTWHPNPQNVKNYNHISHKPLCINIWLERGTVISHSGVVVEPAFMWRDAYQPMLGKHKLNNSTQKPWTMRLLNACRITPSSALDRSKYPLARQQCCFLLKSCTGEEFLLEAKGPDEVETITERWKLAVARFASLAVTEDVNGIAKEFFHPTVDSQMLTVPEHF
ncbi:MAG: hypothetical protein SGILL_003431 [Bacillariaceae sp.]